MSLSRADKEQMTPRNTRTTGTGSFTPDEPVFLVIGKLRRPHGVHGEMIMELMTDFPERIKPGKTVYVGEEYRSLKISGVRPYHNALLIRFEEFLECESVGLLRNQLVYVKTTELPELGEGEYYFHQLIGMAVIDEKGQPVGTLEEILETGANDVYLIRAPDGNEVLVPAVEAFILGVDLESRIITIRLIEWV